MFLILFLKSIVSKDGFLFPSLKLHLKYKSVTTILLHFLVSNLDTLDYDITQQNLQFKKYENL